MRSLRCPNDPKVKETFWEKAISLTTLQDSPGTATSLAVSERWFFLFHTSWLLRFQRFISTTVSLIPLERRDGHNQPICCASKMVCLISYKLQFFSNSWSGLSLLLSPGKLLIKPSQTRHGKAENSGARTYSNGPTEPFWGFTARRGRHPGGRMARAQGRSCRRFQCTMTTF